MGAHPKRRISSARAGRRQKSIKIDTKQPAQHPIPLHKRGFVDQLKKLFTSNE